MPEAPNRTLRYSFIFATLTFLAAGTGGIHRACVRDDAKRDQGVEYHVASESLVAAVAQDALAKRGECARKDEQRPCKTRVR